MKIENNPTAKRRGNPNWKAGLSGNPGGRPKAEGEVTALARARGKTAFERLCTLMDSDNEMVVLRACEAILDRAYGRPRQALDAAGDPERPMGVVIVPAELTPEEWARKYSHPPAALVPAKAPKLADA